MKTTYLNTRTAQGVETVEQFTQGSDDAPANMRDFSKYINEMMKEYSASGTPVYRSQRCTNDWKA